MQVVSVNQRQRDDCAICTAAMVMSYPYEQVLEDRHQRYPRFDDKTAWWEWYFQDEGRQIEYLPLQERDAIRANHSNVLGVIGLKHHGLSVGHIVVLDELGVVDPADGLPDHMAFADWRIARLSQGFVLEREFLAVLSPETAPEADSSHEPTVA